MRVFQVPNPHLPPNQRAVGCVAFAPAGDVASAQSGMFTGTKQCFLSATFHRLPIAAGELETATPKNQWNQCVLSPDARFAATALGALAVNLWLPWARQ